MRKNWTEHEIQYLTKSWGKASLNQIMEDLDRTASAIRKRALALGISDIANRWSEEKKFPLCKGKIRHRRLKVGEKKNLLFYTSSLVPYIFESGILL